MASALTSSGGSLTKLGLGTLTLSGANSYTGATTISAGTLVLGANNPLASTSAITINGGTLEVSAANQVNTLVRITSGAITGAGTLTSSVNSFLAFQISGVVSISAALAGPGGADISGSPVILSGANTYAGNTRLNGGTLKLGASEVIPNGSGKGLFEMNNGLGTTLDLNTFSETINGFGSGIFTGSAIDTFAGGTPTFTVGDNNTTSTFTGTFRNTAGTLSLVKIGTGTLTLDPGQNFGFTNTYSGTTTVAAGTLLVKFRGNPAATLLGSTTAGTTVLTGATLNLDNAAFTTISAEPLVLNGSGAAGAGALAITTTSGSYLTLSGGITLASDTTINTSVSVNSTLVLSGVISGSGNLTRNGEGTLILSGANTYTGNTTINSGQLTLGASNVLPDTGDLTLNTTAPLNLAGFNETVGAFTANGGGVSGSGTLTATSFTFGDNTVAFSNLAGTGGFTSSGSVSVAGTNTYTGGTTINTGTLFIDSDSNLGSASGAVTFAGGSLRSSQSFTSARPTTLNSGGGSFSPGSGVTITWTGNISGTGALAKTGAGILALTGTGTYAGGTTISAGTLQIGTGGTTGSLTGNITNNAALVFNRSDTLAYTSAISGTGSLTKQGAGALNLTGANTYTGTTSVSAGTLLVNGSLANTNVAVANGATLGGSGSLGGLTTLNSGAHLAPGNSPGTITFNQGLVLQSGSILDFQLGTASDQIVLAGGSLTGPGTVGGVTLNLSDSGGFAAGTYTLINYTSAVASSSYAADSFALGSTIPGYTYNLSLSSNSLQLTATASAIPEPATYAALLGACALGLAALRRRRRSAHTG